MKKLSILLLSLFLVVGSAISVLADSDVISLTVSGDKNSIEVSGTTSAGLAAVVVEIIDNGDNNIALYSFAVNSDDTFSGTIDNLNLAAGAYTVRAANYEGGEWQSTRIVISSDSSSGPSRTAVPNTATK